MASNPILYAALMTLWLVAFPGFLIISSLSVIIVMSAVCRHCEVYWELLLL